MLGLVVHRFWTNHVPDKEDAAKLVPQDWCEYGPIQGLDRNRTNASIRSLSNLQPLSSGTNPAIVMAHARWDAIRPQYEAWKSGQEAPVSGTPLSAWNALSAEQADLFKTRGIKTVEDIAEMTDAHISSIRLPNIRSLVEQAKRFIASADQTRLAAELAKKDQEIDALKAENADRDDQIKALVEKVDQLATLAAREPAEEEQLRRGPGRPRKQVAA